MKSVQGSAGTLGPIALAVGLAALVVGVVAITRSVDVTTDVIRERRLQDSSIPAYGIPYDLAGASKLAREQPFAFETWAVTRLNGFVPNIKQVADGGVDGRGTVWEQPDGDVTRLALAQVKGGVFSLSG